MKPSQFAVPVFMGAAGVNLLQNGIEIRRRLSPNREGRHDEAHLRPSGFAALAPMRHTHILSPRFFESMPALCRVGPEEDHSLRLAEYYDRQALPEHVLSLSNVSHNVVEDSSHVFPSVGASAVSPEILRAIEELISSAPKSSANSKALLARWLNGEQ